MHVTVQHISAKKLPKNYLFTTDGAKEIVNDEIASGGKQPISGSMENGESTSWIRSVGTATESSEFAPNT